MDDPPASDLILGRHGHLSSVTPLIGIHDSAVLSANGGSRRGFTLSLPRRRCCRQTPRARFNPTGFCYVVSGCSPAAPSQKISGVTFQGNIARKKKKEKCVKRSECRSAGASYFLYSPHSITFLFSCQCSDIKEQIIYIFLKSLTICYFTFKRYMVLFD